MAAIIPEDFDPEGVERSLAKVVALLADRLGDEWLILPHVPFVENGVEGEVDVILVHPQCGLIFLEAKGGAIALRDGTWLQNGLPMRSPVDQVADGKHAIKRKIQRALGRDALVGVRHCHGVVFPDVDAVPGGTSIPDLDQRMILTASELQWPEDALAALVGETNAVSANHLEEIVRLLRPTVEFSGSLGDQLRGIRRRLGAQTDRVIRVTRNLDMMNDRMLVYGPAGAGKTKLAVAWARRAAAAGQRVLLTCYNEPIGFQLQGLFQDEPLVTVGPFMPLALRWLSPWDFPAPPADDAPNHEKRAYYEALPSALAEHRSEIGAAFDLVIIDEVQDFKPEWLETIRSMLDPEGPRREFLLGDQNQDLFDHGQDEVWDLASDGWVRFPLDANCRNTLAIAAVAARLVTGTEAFPDNPPGPDVRYFPVDGPREAWKRVRDEVRYLAEEQRVPLSEIAVITTRARIKDHLIDKSFEALERGDGDVNRLVAWSARDEDAVVCETSYKLKGTEWQAVVMVNLEPTDGEGVVRSLYVGVTRATTWLSVVGTAETAELLHLRP